MCLVNLLSKNQYLETMNGSMNRISTSIGSLVDLWSYIDAIPEKDLILDSDLASKKIYSIYMNDNKTYEHVLISTKRNNYFLVVVIDVSAETIYGYYLLDLNEEYGLN